MFNNKGEINFFYFLWLILVVKGDFDYYFGVYDYFVNVNFFLILLIEFFVMFLF